MPAALKPRHHCSASVSLSCPLALAPVKLLAICHLVLLCRRAIRRLLPLSCATSSKVHPEPIRLHFLLALRPRRKPPSPRRPSPRRQPAFPSLYPRPNAAPIARSAAFPKTSGHCR